MVLRGSLTISRRLLLLVLIFVGTVILLSSKSVVNVLGFSEMAVQSPLDQISPQEALRVAADLKPVVKRQNFVSSISGSTSQTSYEEYYNARMMARQQPTSAPSPSLG